MDAKEVILGSLEQSQGYLNGALDGLTQEEFAWSSKAECNSIAFILWHIARVEDFFINRVIQREKELHEVEGWQEKLGTPVKAYGLTVEELQAWPVPKLEDLRGYAKAVREKTLTFLKAIPPEKGTDPAAMPLAIPLGTTARRWAWATRITADTSSVLAGLTTTSGRCSAKVPSYE